MKRICALLAVVAITLSLSTGPAAAQFATPTVEIVSGADLGLPEFAIEITDDTFVSAPEVPAGRVLVTVTNATEANLSQPFFVQIPEEETLESLQAHVDALAALLQNGEMPEDGSDPSAFLYDLHIAGGTSAPAGSARQVIVELTPGNWAIADLDFAKPLAPVTVTGEMPAELPEIPVDATINAIDTGDTFDFSLDGTISSGLQIVAVVNGSTQPHYTEFTKLPDGFQITEEMFGELIMIDMEMATPNPDVSYPSADDFLIYGFASLQSTGTTQWLITSFEPGTYSTTCWVPDPRHGGAPHSAMGMYAIFSVE